MEKLEYIESKLANLTEEFKTTKIKGIDGNYYTFESYLRDYISTIMRDDFTFGDDDIFNNIDSLIILQETMTGIQSQPTIELPRLKQDIKDDKVNESSASEQVLEDQNNQTFDIQYLMSELDASEDLGTGYSNHQFQIELEFTSLVEELLFLLDNINSLDSDFVFIYRLERYKNDLATRFNYEEEKQDNKKGEVTLDDFCFAFDTIKSRIEKLKNSAETKSKLSEKGQTNFEAVCAIVDKIKEELDQQTATKELLEAIL